MIDVLEVAVFVSRNFVVSVRHGESNVLRGVRQARSTARSTPPGMGPMCVLHQAADHIVDDYERAIASIDDIESASSAPRVVITPSGFTSSSAK